MPLSGRLPENDAAAGWFFLLLLNARMEPTYAVEGDYDSSNVETKNGETPPKLAG
jgi:hypothetical protein